MSRGWKKTDLFIGERVDLPEELFISTDKAKKRLLSCRFIGETETGMRFEVEFPKCWGSDDNRRYEIFVMFASVYCGDIKIYRNDRTQLKAERQVEKLNNDMTYRKIYTKGVNYGKNYIK